jgi:hypothetical protein
MKNWDKVEKVKVRLLAGGREKIITAKSIGIDNGFVKYQYKYKKQDHVIVVPLDYQEVYGQDGRRVIHAIEGKAEAVPGWGMPASNVSTTDMALLAYSGLGEKMIKSVSSTSIDFKKLLIIGGIALVVIFVVSRMMGG